MVRRWEASGQSVRAFCRGQDVSEPSFYAWRRILGRRGGSLTPESPRTQAPAFLRVEVGAESRGTRPTRIAIVLSSGEHIRLRAPVDRAALVEVLAALRLAARED